LVITVAKHAADSYLGALSHVEPGSAVNQEFTEAFINYQNSPPGNVENPAGSFGSVKPQMG
jgi:hypothetical protein